LLLNCCLFTKLHFVIALQRNNANIGEQLVEHCSSTPAGFFIYANNGGIVRLQITPGDYAVTYTVAATGG
jgi:hypothetical protein